MSIVSSFFLYLFWLKFHGKVQMVLPGYYHFFFIFFFFIHHIISYALFVINYGYSHNGEPARTHNGRDLIGLERGYLWATFYNIKRSIFSICWFCYLMGDFLTFLHVITYNILCASSFVCVCMLLFCVKPVWIKYYYYYIIYIKYKVFIWFSAYHSSPTRPDGLVKPR